MSQISLTWQSISLPAFSHLITHSPGLKVEANFSEVCFCSPSSHRANWHLMWSSHYISPKTEEKTRWRKEPLKASLAQFLTQLPTLSWVCPLYPSLPPPQEGSELAKLTMVRPSAEHKGKPNRFFFFFFLPSRMYNGQIRSISTTVQSEMCQVLQCWHTEKSLWENRWGKRIPNGENSKDISLG